MDSFLRSHSKKHTDKTQSKFENSGPTLKQSGESESTFQLAQLQTRPPISKQTIPPLFTEESARQRFMEASGSSEGESQVQQATLLGSDGATEDLLPEMPSNHRIGYRSRSPLSGRETSQSRGTKQYNSAVSPVDTLEQADVAHPLTPSNL